MQNSRKIVLIVLIVVGLAGYSQYVAAYQIDVKINQSTLVKQNDKGSTYNVQLEFNNPSLLMLNAGITDFEVTVEDDKIADGVLEPFVLPAMSKVSVNGEYLTIDKSPLIEDEQYSDVIISGVTKYDVFFTSIDVPFVYFPTEEQAREFIQQN